LSSLLNFRNHPALRRLCLPISPAKDMVWKIEQELQEEDGSLTMPIVRDEGRIIITVGWFIHCPRSRDFWSRLWQPLAILTDSGAAQQAGQTGSRTSQGIAAPSIKALLLRSLTVLVQLPTWLRLLRQSLPGSVQISSLHEVQIRLASEPEASAVQRAKAAGLKEVRPQGQIIFWNPTNSSFAGLLADGEEVQKLAKEAGTRQALATRIHDSMQRAENGGQMPQMVEGGVDPRRMTRDDCYKALQLTSSELKAVNSKEEAQKRLARAFTLRVLENKEGEQQKIERLALAFDLLLRRVCLSLEL